MQSRPSSRHFNPLRSTRRLARVVVAAAALLGTATAMAEQVSLTKASDPGGIVSGETWHESGTDVVVAAPPDTSGNYKFCYWLLNGARQTDAPGNSVASFTFRILENTTATALYLPVDQDADGDGVPDWYELRVFGTTEFGADHDPDGDGRGISQEFPDGTNPRVAEYRLIENSDPPGVVATDRFILAGSAVTTTPVPMQTNGTRFVHWLVNGVRQEITVGTANSRPSIVMDSPRTATAVYVDETLDSDGDGIPDWYEMFHYGSLESGADSDTDVDGRTLIEEYLLGAHPRIADTAASGGIIEGGAARRRGAVLALELAESRHRIEERSLPRGVLGRVQYVAHGTEVSTQVAPSAVADHRFVHWLLNGVRQTASDGMPLHQLTFTPTGDTLADAVYLPVSLDADGDGVPDWFEVYYHGDTSRPADSDTDGDGRTLAEEYALGLNPLRKEWQFRQVSLPTGLVTPRDEYLVDGTSVLTANVTSPPEGMEFGHWTLNGIRQETENGVAVRSIRFTLTEDTVAEAYFLPLDEDADGDAVPDWFEIRHYGNLDQTAGSDSDGDGRSLLEEYLQGTQPRIADSASDGLVAEGGIARRRGVLTTLVLNDGYRRYTERSSPPGILSREEVLPVGSPVTTASAASSYGSYRFVHWLRNGERQEGENGLPLAQVALVLDEDVVVEAVYVESSQDLDEDGALDWFEMFHYGTTGLAADSDTDGDGRTLWQEFADNTQPRTTEWRYIERNQPSGPSARDEFLVHGTQVTTVTAAAEISGQRFVHWLLNGARQQSLVGTPISRLQLTMDRNIEAVAVYINSNLDADADSVPDWYEIFHYGTTELGGDSDSDSDGRTLIEEFRLGTHPVIADTAASGGIVEGGIARRRGEGIALNLQFFPASQLLGADGEGIFSDPYGGANGSFVMPEGGSAPALGDIDGDGDLDLLIGGGAGGLRFFRNTGSPFSPQLVEDALAVAGLPHWPSGPTYPALADWNGDGRADLVAGSNDGILRFYVSQSGGETPLVWVGNLTAGTGAVYPAFLPASGGPDLLVLDGITGLVSRYAHGSGNPPYAVPALSGDLLGTPVENGTSLAVVDANRDGILDVVASDHAGRLWRFNGGSGGSYTLTSKVWGGTFDGFRSGLRGAVADLDGDGDPDIIGGGTDGRLVYLRNPEKHLRVDPVVATVGLGEQIAFSSIDDDGTLLWSVSINRSGATIGSSSAIYQAGSTTGIDQIHTLNAAGRSGVAWINVVDRGDSAAPTWSALLVDGRRGPNDPVWPAAHALNTRAREVLLYRGIDPSNILWLGHGAGADAAPTRDALAGALRDGVGLATDTNFLMVNLVDHGRVAPDGDGVFLLAETETVTGTELDQWLDALQSARPGLSVVVVVESCYAARVAGPMAGADAFASRRLVLASSGNDELAHLAANGLVSYSAMLWSDLAAGRNIDTAHESAASALSDLQTASASGAAALGALRVGLQGVAGSGRPVISSAQNDIVLQESQEALLDVTVDSAFAIERVWGVVVPPGYRATGDAPVVDLPQVELSRDISSGRWTSRVGGFTESGAPYIVLLQARDVWGQVGAPTLLRVHQAGVRNRVIIFAHGEESWLGAPVAGSLAAYSREVALLRRVREEDVLLLADEVFALDDATPAGGSELQAAIESWANADGQLAALTVFAVGQGSQLGMVCANGDMVTPADLKSWLDSLQESSGATVQMIVDSDYSGRFVAQSGSSAHRRITVSSTGVNERNTFASGRWSNVTRWMWNSIARGRDLRESYAEANDLARLIGGPVPSLFDDNGDGSFTKLKDGLRAINSFVGSAYVTADDPPFISRASARIQVASGRGARFWVSHIVMPDGNAPESVWFEVLGPDGAFHGTGDLWHNPTKDRHEGSFAAFSDPGSYFVFVQAGTKGDPARTTPPTVIQIDYASTPDHGAPLSTGLPALTLPLDGRAMDVETDTGGDWKLHLTRGQRVVVEAREVSVTRDVGIQILGANNRVLAAADVWGNGFGEIIDGWEAPADGTYLVRATFATGSGLAECKIRGHIKHEAGADGIVPLPIQSIIFAPPATHPLNGGPLELVATATSGLAVRFEVISGHASLNGDNLTATGEGPVVIRAYQDGNHEWESAEPVEHTITITPAVIDTYESWARAIFGDDYETIGLLDHDADGDGQSNHGEWMAKTDPRDARDKFEVASAGRVETGFRLRWLARDGVNYRVCWSDDLLRWHELPGSRVTGSGNQAEVGDPTPPPGTGFYRVEVLPP